MPNALELSLADPWGHAVAACRARMEEGSRPALASTDEPETAGADLLAIARELAPDLFPDEAHDALVAEVSRELVDAVYALGRIEDQARYEEAYVSLSATLEAWDARLRESRFLRGDSLDDLCFADLLLFAFLVRIDPVYFELYKAAAFLLADLPELQAFARDLYELPELWSTTDWDVIKAHHYLREPVLNPKRIVPAGGIPDLDTPSFRAERFTLRTNDDGTEEDQAVRRGAGEWVRPQSGLRHWITPDADAQYPAEPGRYHLYAPFNCPWSHRALLARGVLGLESVVSASVVYFRRHPKNGWQFNPRIPGCTDDPLHGSRYVVELYEKAGSKERSVPVLWDSRTDTIVSNESAEVLRMFNGAFGDLAGRDVDLYPAPFREEIDRLNALVYQRINNGAYKAGFAGSQAAYDRAFARYFAALDWLEALLAERRWLAGTDALTEADLRLFPTVYRHDAVYFARFKLNLRRISDYPRLSDWLKRMLDVPGVSESSNMDHARNGYFGRTGNEIVPAGPIPLGLSRSSFSDEVWLNEG